MIALSDEERNVALQSLASFALATSDRLVINLMV